MRSYSGRFSTVSRRVLCSVLAILGPNEMVQAQSGRLALTAPATDSTFPLAGCGDPFDMPTGRISADGVVAYLLRPDGAPDTSSIRVVESEVVSAAGLRSAASRRLARCRMMLPYGYQGPPIPVRQRLNFLETGFGAEPAERTVAMPEGLSLEPPEAATRPVVWALEDPAVEEQPWQSMGCRPKGLPSLAGERFRSREEADRAMQEYTRRVSGKVILLLTVDTNGTVVPGSDSLVLGENPLTTNALTASIKDCRFLPARIGGVPVRARTLGRMEFAGARPAGP
jgi:hypothetical protein